MRRQRWVQFAAVVIPVFVTVVLWAMAKSARQDSPSVFQALTQIVSLVGYTLMFEVLVISARNRTVEKLYGGLDKSYKLHGTLAKLSMLLLVLHPLLLIPHYLSTRQEVLHLFWWSDFWPRNLGIASLYLLILLIGLTLWRRMDYQKWLWGHKAMGIGFLLGAVHAIHANSDIKAFEPLRDWAWILAILGVSAWLYKAVLYRWLAQQYDYVIESVSEQGRGIWELRMNPKSARMNYEPGEFAFISVRGNPSIPEEQHPFSIRSDPARRGLAFGFKAVGDYTRKLTRAKPGDRVKVYGPYGEFTSYMLDEYKRQVWVAGGIGVTPFLAMLGHESHNEDHKDVTLYYSVKSLCDEVYDQEIKDLIRAADHPMRYVQHISDRDGFLTADRILADCPDTENTAYLFCGPPPMMRALKKQLVAQGASPDRIFFEDFAFV